jgi:hypothetical protein
VEVQGSINYSVVHVFGSVLGLCRNFGGCVVALVNCGTSMAMHLLCLFLLLVRIEIFVAPLVGFCTVALVVLSMYAVGCSVWQLLWWFFCSYFGDLTPVRAVGFCNCFGGFYSFNSSWLIRFGGSVFSVWFSWLCFCCWLLLLVTIQGFVVALMVLVQ